MIDLMQEFEVRATLADKDREARSAFRASEAGGAPRGLGAAFVSRLAGLVLRTNRGTAREPTISGS